MVVTDPFPVVVRAYPSVKVLFYLAVSVTYSTVHTTN